MNPPSVIPSPAQFDTIGATAPIFRTRTPDATASFAEHLAQWDATGPSDASVSTAPEPGDQRARDARRAAEEFVAAAFIEPILAQLRETSTAEGPFAPSAAERRFGPLLDQRIAHRVVKGARFPLVDRLEEQLQKPAPGVTIHDK